MESPADIHNRLSREIVMTIIRETVGAGGTPTQALILTESILVGVTLTLVKLGGDEKVLDVMVDGARQRLAEIRLAETSGSA